MDQHEVSHNRLLLVIEILLTIGLCFGMASTSFIGLEADTGNLEADIMTDYDMLLTNYIRSFKVLRMEAVEQINKDLSFDDMMAWAQSRDEVFLNAVGDGVYDGFAFTYKGGYVHSWNYGDYTNYVPSERPWYQIAEQAKGEIAIVAPYTTFLSGTSAIEKYDTLRLSVTQKYNDTISFDYDLDVKEINNIIASQQTIYEGTNIFLYDDAGYILSSSNDSYYGHNLNTADAVVTKDLSNSLLQHDLPDFCLQTVDGTLYFMFEGTNDHNMHVRLMVPFQEVFARNFLFVFLLGIVLIAMEVFFFFNTKKHIMKLEEGRIALNDALQQAEGASHAKGDFMSHMSHEIRTPLNAMIGYLDIAKDEQNDPEKVQHCIEKSQLASRHLLSIINDVLDVSSIESGKMKIAHEDFDFKQMIDTLTVMFYAQAKNKNVNFEVHLEKFNHEWVIGDELRVRQILLNLLSNAVKFTPRGGSVSLNITQVDISDTGNKKIHMEFEVKDSGVGMSQEYLSRIFKPFEQETSGTAKSFGGTGLGLSITNNLTHMMGGQIKVESEQGKGSTFTVLLPFDVSQQHESRTTDSFAHLSVLVVDDEEDTCEYMQKLCTRFGMKCDTVTSGKKGIRRVTTRLEQNRPYDICIIDWNMDGLNGIETAREIRKITGKEMPIIIATAYEYSAIEDEAKEAGVDKIVSKPLFQSTLLNILVNTYGKYKMRQPEEDVQIDFKGKKVLLAEDNEMNMEIAVDILTKAGLVITPVVNGQEALDTFTKSEEGTFDAILMDIQMPVMDGYTATREIRASSHPQAKSIPIIAMTANAFTEDVTAALSAGMNGHIAKPVDYRSLFAVLKKVIKI